MNDLPEWAVDLLKQFPVLGVCLVIVWIVVIAITKRYEQLLQKFDKMYKERIKELKDQHRELLKAKEEEIARLLAENKELRGEQGQVRPPTPEEEPK